MYTESDIPGFYYDEVTKNYYKILPDQMSSVPSFITNEKIKKQEVEKQRQKDVKALQAVHCPSLFPDTCNKLPMPTLIHRLQCGFVSRNNLHNFSLRRQCRSLHKDSDGIQAKGSNLLPK